MKMFTCENCLHLGYEYDEIYEGLIAFCTKKEKYISESDSTCEEFYEINKGRLK